MERLDVVARAAARVRACCCPERTGANTGPVSATELTGRLCEKLQLELQVTPGNDIMLGGAYSRLQLWAWDQPEFGGIIWLRDDLDAETRAFAVAHEIGHYALHRGESIALQPACDQREVDQDADAGALRTEGLRVEEYTPRARRELEANAFAAELLAPRAEARRLFTRERGMDAAQLASRWGISQTLAQRRLMDAVLIPTLPQDMQFDAAHDATHRMDGEALDAPTANNAREAFDALDRLDPAQREAACASGPALVIAGPGSGKTAALVGRAAYLVEQRGFPPERVLALTFSNRAAAEMRERLVAAGLPGERMPVMTIHAFAAALLREYASRVPHAVDEAELMPEFRILDEANAFLLMEELLAALPLRYYRSLGNPTTHLRTLLKDFSHARDALLTPDDYLALVEAMPLAPESPEEPSTATNAGDGHGKHVKDSKSGKARPPEGVYTAEQIAKARERAACYRVWDRALRQRGLVDFGGLIQRAVELLQAAPEVLDEVRSRFPQLLVDEFQDTNYAAAELLWRMAGESGSGLWVVGDRNQSIYRFRGASPGNLYRLVERYPELRVCILRRCYRSVPAIVRLGSTIATHMANRASRAPEQVSASRASDVAALNGASVVLGLPGSGEPDGRVGAPVTLRKMPGGTSGKALGEIMHPQKLEAVRPPAAHAAILRCESFASATHEHVGLAAAIEQQRARGAAYGEQAVLCRTHKQAQQIAATLTACDVPVDQVGDFFALPELKDALALIAVAAGPDARGLLRADALLTSLGYPPPRAGELAIVAQALAKAHRPLPRALTHLDAVDALKGAPTLTAATRAGLRALGAAALELHYGVSITKGLCAFLLRPGGYAWRLARMADGIGSADSAEAAVPLDGAGSMVNRTTALPVTSSAGRARSALAALGEFVRLTARFDRQWSQEPDFRARLTLAVTHRSVARRPVAQLTEADTEQPAPAADAMPFAVRVESAERTEQENAGDVGATAPAVRCFLHYLKALRASANLAASTLVGEEDAVHVLTLHQSKGLEFPIIYLPGLAQGQFPQVGTRKEDVCPPGFRESDAPGEREAEERSLFYVGVTRARETVVFTRAQAYGKVAQPSPLLTLLDGDEEGSTRGGEIEPLLPDTEIERLLYVANALAQTEDDQSDDERDDMGSVVGPDETMARPTFRLRELEQYLTCPLQYKYAQRYMLLDPAEDAVYRFHRYIRRGARELHDLRTSAPDCDWPTAAERLRALWETAGPAGHAYDAFYWQRAEQILRVEWDTLTSPSSAAPLSQALPAQTLQARLRRCIVEVTADRVVSAQSTVLQDGSRAASELTLVRLRTGRQREADTKDLALPLYYLAHQQQQPEAPVSIVLNYVGDALSGDESQSAGVARNEIVDVTEIARTAAEKYVEPGRKRRSTLDKLDEAAEGILAGRFAPRPGETRCAACAYCHVCPADPDSAEVSAATSATSATSAM